MQKAKKISSVEKIGNILSKEAACVFFSYHKLSVEKMTSLRMELKNSNNNLQVAKNTLAKVAAKSCLPEETKLDTFFKGSATAIAYGDASTCAKTVKKFLKANPDLVCVKGGMVDGMIFEENEFEKIASMPTREELIHKLQNLVIAPIIALQKAIISPAIAVQKIKHAINSSKNDE